jgi:hypothetical protein
MQTDTPKFASGYFAVEVGLKHLVDRSGKVFAKKYVVQEGETVGLVLNENIEPSKCRAFLSPNPALINSGWLSYPPIIEEGEGNGEIVIWFKADQKVDLSKLSWISRVYCVE